MAKIRFIGQLTGYRNGVLYPPAGSAEVWDVPDDEAKTFVDVLEVAVYVDDEARAANDDGNVETRKSTGLTKKSTGQTKKTED